MDVLPVVSRVLGSLLLLAWLIFIPIGRFHVSWMRGVMPSTLFLFHILPFILGMGLVISGSLWVMLTLLVVPVAWILSMFFPKPKFFILIFPLPFGWVYGNVFFSYLYPNSTVWHHIGGIIGIISMFILCKIVVAYVTTPLKKKLPKEQEDIIEGLDNILKCLYVALLNLYKAEFANDSNETNRHRAGVVLNELVLEELRGNQVDFKNQNIDFIDKEKKKILETTGIRRGIVSFLAAKGALYENWGHSKADLWINEAKRLHPDVIIPKSSSDILQEIDNCLLYYKQNTTAEEIELN
jgi:hypothetical protein